MTEDAIHIDIDPNDEKLKALDYRQFQEKLPLVFKIQKYEIPSDKENIIYNIPDYSDMNALFEGLRKYCSNIEMKKPKKQIDIPNITPFPPPKERIQELFSQSDTFDNIKYSDQIKQDIQSEETEIRETHKTSLKERKIMFASGIKIVEKMTTYESNTSKGKVSELISPNPPPPQPLLLTGIQPLRQMNIKIKLESQRNHYKIL
ncbi:MAG: hypothetical protein EZS28_019557 [Streblomastix strix]|uniref:Uncharacterized protein n=1 Tax=Streblomastix strix TaxID=222440 RepID=A0A5J4VQH1_9EUKA|nr:MAG: hypothetical protein EZS28_019557 [Streblomastix strix]